MIVAKATLLILLVCESSGSPLFFGQSRRSPSRGRHSRMPPAFESLRVMRPPPRIPRNRPQHRHPPHPPHDQAPSADSSGSYGAPHKFCSRCDQVPWIPSEGPADNGGYGPPQLVQHMVQEVYHSEPTEFQVTSPGFAHQLMTGPGGPGYGGPVLMEYGPPPAPSQEYGGPPPGPPRPNYGPPPGPPPQNYGPPPAPAQDYGGPPPAPAQDYGGPPPGQYGAPQPTFQGGSDTFRLPEGYEPNAGITSVISQLESGSSYAQRPRLEDQYQRPEDHTQIIKSLGKYALNLEVIPSVEYNLGTETIQAPQGPQNAYQNGPEYNSVTQDLTAPQQYQQFSGPSNGPGSVSYNVPAQVNVGTSYEATSYQSATGPVTSQHSVTSYNVPGPVTSHNAPGPSTSYQAAPGPSTSYNAPGPSTSYQAAPGPSTSYQAAPGPSTSYQAVPGPSTSYNAPGPSTSYNAPGPSTSYQAAPGPSTSYQPVPGPLTLHQEYTEQVHSGPTSYHEFSGSLFSGPVTSHDVIPGTSQQTGPAPNQYSGHVSANQEFSGPVTVHQSAPVTVPEISGHVTSVQDFSGPVTAPASSQGFSGPASYSVTQQVSGQGNVQVHTGVAEMDHTKTILQAIQSLEQQPVEITSIASADPENPHRPLTVQNLQKQVQEQKTTPVPVISTTEEVKPVEQHLELDVPEQQHVLYLSQQPPTFLVVGRRPELGTTQQASGGYQTSTGTVSSQPTYQSAGPASQPAYQSTATVSSQPTYQSTGQVSSQQTYQSTGTVSSTPAPSTASNYGFSSIPNVDQISFVADNSLPTSPPVPSVQPIRFEYSPVPEPPVTKPTVSPAPAISSPILSTPEKSTPDRANFVIENSVPIQNPMGPTFPGFEPKGTEVPTVVKESYVIAEQPESTPGSATNSAVGPDNWDVLDYGDDDGDDEGTGTAKDNPFRPGTNDAVSLNVHVIADPEDPAPNEFAAGVRQFVPTLLRQSGTGKPSSVLQLPILSSPGDDLEIDVGGTPSGAESESPEPVSYVNLNFGNSTGQSDEFSLYITRGDDVQYKPPIHTTGQGPNVGYRKPIHVETEKDEGQTLRVTEAKLSFLEEKGARDNAEQVTYRQPINVEPVDNGKREEQGVGNYEIVYNTGTGEAQQELDSPKTQVLHVEQAQTDRPSSASYRRPIENNEAASGSGTGTADGIATSAPAESPSVPYQYRPPITSTAQAQEEHSNLVETSPGEVQPLNPEPTDQPTDEPYRYRPQTADTQVQQEQSNIETSPGEVLQLNPEPTERPTGAPYRYRPPVASTVQVQDDAVETSPGEVVPLNPEPPHRPTSAPYRYRPPVTVQAQHEQGNIVETSPGEVLHLNPEPTGPTSTPYRYRPPVTNTVQAQQGNIVESSPGEVLHLNPEPTERPTSAPYRYRPPVSNTAQAQQGNIVETSQGEVIPLSPTDTPERAPYRYRPPVTSQVDDNVETSQGEVLNLDAPSRSPYQQPSGTGPQDETFETSKGEVLHLDGTPTNQPYRPDEPAHEVSEGEHLNFDVQKVQTDEPPVYRPPMHIEHHTGTLQQIADDVRHRDANQVKTDAYVTGSSSGAVDTSPVQGPTYSHRTRYDQSDPGDKPTEKVLQDNQPGDPNYLTRPNAYHGTHHRKPDCPPGGHFYHPQHVVRHQTVSSLHRTAPVHDTSDDYIGASASSGDDTDINEVHRSSSPPVPVPPPTQPPYRVTQSAVEPDYLRNFPEFASPEGSVLGQEEEAAVRGAMVELRKVRGSGGHAG